MLGFASTLVEAEETITDPRKYCDQVAELLVAGDSDELASDIYTHSNGMISEIDFKAGLATLAPFITKAGPVISHEHISELELGKSYVRHWYILIYQGGPLFVRCSMYQAGSRWVVFNFSANTDPDKIGLTQ